MKHIAILSTSLRGGGIEKELLLIAGELSRRNLDVEIVVVNTIDSAYAPGPNIRLVDLGASRMRYALIPLMKYLKRARPQTVFCAETPLNALAILARAITGFPKRLIVSERNHLSSVAEHAKRLGDAARPFLAKYLYPHADLITTVSLGVAEDLIRSSKVNPQKVRPLYNMFDVENIIRKSQEEAPFLPKDDFPVILNVGRLTPQKDQATLVKAFAVLREKIPCRLIILGEGGERSNLSQLARRLNIENDVLMPGFAPNPYAYMARARIFALSSIYEGLPGVLIEALACGTPIVSTDCPSGPAEILDGGKYGTLTPVGDVAAFANAMLKMLAQPVLSDALRARSMDFSVEKLMPQYLDIFFPPHNPT